MTQTILLTGAAGDVGSVLRPMLRARYDIVGSFDMATCFRFGGIPFEDANASMDLFGNTVLEEVRSWA